MLSASPVWSAPAMLPVLWKRRWCSVRKRVVVIFRPNKVGLLTVANLIGGILLFSGLRLWKTAVPNKPALIKKRSFAGLPNPARYRGSYTYQDVTNALCVPVESCLRVPITKRSNSAWESGRAMACQHSRGNRREPIRFGCLATVHRHRFRSGRGDAAAGQRH